MRMLINSVNYANCGTHALHESWFRVLEKYVDIDYVGRGFPLKKPGNDYDIFMVYVMRNFNLKSYEAKGAFKILFDMDYAAFPDKLIAFCKTHKMNMLVIRYRNNYEYLERHLSIPVIYLPWSFDSGVFYNRNLTRDINLFFAGTVRPENLYRDRLWLKEKMELIPRSLFMGGLRDIGRGITEDTANWYNLSKISVALSSERNFLLAKYFEIAACKSLLFCSDAVGLSDHFKDGDSCVTFKKDFSDFYEKYQHYILEENRLKIAEKAYRLAHENHTHAIRAREFIRELAVHI